MKTVRVNDYIFVVDKIQAFWPLEDSVSVLVGKEIFQIYCRVEDDLIATGSKMKAVLYKLRKAVEDDDANY